MCFILIPDSRSVLFLPYNGLNTLYTETTLFCTRYDRQPRYSGQQLPTLSDWKTTSVQQLLQSLHWGNANRLQATHRPSKCVYECTKYTFREATVTDIYVTSFSCLPKLPEQYRLMHIQPPKKKNKHKHKHHRPQDPLPPGDSPTQHNNIKKDMRAFVDKNLHFLPQKLPQIQTIRRRRKRKMMTRTERKRRKIRRRRR